MTEEKKLTGYPSIDKPWLRYYSEEIVSRTLPNCTIYDYLVMNNKEYPKDIAILYLGRKITYGELFNKIDETAKAFCALGVKPGEIVTVALPSIPEALYTVYALNKIGAVANMIHPLAGEVEMMNYLNEVSSKIAVLFEDSYAIVKNVLNKTKVEKVIVVSAGESLPFGVKNIFFLKNPRIRVSGEEGVKNWLDFIQTGNNTDLPTYNKDPNSLALISHTGGTTGEPKGVMCSDNNVNSLIYQIVCNFEFKRQSTCLASLPPFINYSLIESMLAMLVIGFKVALIPKYQKEKIGDYIRRYKPYVIISIPVYWEPLLETKEIKSYNMSCLRYAIYGGEAMSVENERAINNVLKICGAKGKLCKGIGSTEMMAAATSTYDDLNDEGSAGIPLVWTNCKIINPESFEELNYGQIGEICFSGPTLMMGYYNNQKETEDVIKIHSDGNRWLHTGDLGYMDEKGILFVTGRVKRILITKGKDGIPTKLFPDRIEKVVSQHEAVSICCAIGVPDDQRVNYPLVYVVLKSGTWEQGKVTKEIITLCQRELPGYMVPDYIVYRDDLPRTPRGKIDYRALEKEKESVFHE